MWDVTGTDTTNLMSKLRHPKLDVFLAGNDFCCEVPKEPLPWITLFGLIKMFWRSRNSWPKGAAVRFEPIHTTRTVWLGQAMSVAEGLGRTQLTTRLNEAVKQWEKKTLRYVSIQYYIILWHSTISKSCGPFKPDIINRLCDRRCHVDKTPGW